MIFNLYCTPFGMFRGAATRGRVPLAASSRTRIGTHLSLSALGEAVGIGCRRGPRDAAALLRNCAGASSAAARRPASTSTSVPPTPSSAPGGKAGRSMCGHYSPPQGQLEGRCSCGSAGWVAQGPSSINFVCHCSICRDASGRSSLPASGLKPTQVHWINEGGDSIDRRTPEGSRNSRLYCRKCGDYIAEDATAVFGVMGLPLHLASDVPDQYRPNHHIFYDSRVQDAVDALPKWSTVLQGQLSEGAPVDEREPGGAVGEDARRNRYDSTTGRYFKDVAHISPQRAPDAGVYTFTEVDPGVNHISAVSEDKLTERVARKYERPRDPFVCPSKKKRDVIIIGGGHNGLVSAAYLAKKGLDVLVLERRHCVGGAAVTEELIPGFKFSRASYLSNGANACVSGSIDGPDSDEDCSKWYKHQCFVSGEALGTDWSEMDTYGRKVSTARGEVKSYRYDETVRRDRNYQMNQATGDAVAMEHSSESLYNTSDDLPNPAIPPPATHGDEESSDIGVEIPVWTGGFPSTPEEQEAYKVFMVAKYEAEERYNAEVLRRRKLKEGRS